MVTNKMAGLAFGTLLLCACSNGATADAAGTAGKGAASTSGAAQASTATSSADASAAEAAVRELYGTYLMSAEQMSYTDPTPVMDQNIYSAELSRIIAAWRTANPGPEPTAFTSVDWICRCQDWNAASASLTVGAVTARDGGRYQVTATFNPGFEAPNASTDYFMVQENGRWLVDDVSFTAAEPMMREILIDETRNPR